jgi:hypothetical protein
MLFPLSSFLVGEHQLIIVPSAFQQSLNPIGQSAQGAFEMLGSAYIVFLFRLVLV